MSNRPLIGDTRGTRTETNVLKGILLGGVAALLLVLGARAYVSYEKSVDVNAAQQSTDQAPTDGENETHQSKFRSG